MLARFGGEAVLRRLRKSAYDPAAGRATRIATDYNLRALAGSYRLGQVDGSLIRSDDRRVLLEAAGDAPAPQPGDRLIMDGATYAIVAVRTLAPAGTPLLHECQARIAK
jgi:hypothetical protein